MLSLSANGISNAILWANEAAGNLPADPDSNTAPTPNIMRAYEVSAVGTGTLQPIWDSEAEPNDRLGAATKFVPPLIANGKVYQATYDNQVVVYGLGSPSATPVRDIRRTVVFIFGQTAPGQDMFVRGGVRVVVPSASVIAIGSTRTPTLSAGATPASIGTKVKLARSSL
jgi:outer membrane protein assembly factor BamB